MSGEIVHITDVEFEAAVLKSEIPVLVDFWAPWCGPCLMIAPVLDETARSFQGKVKVVKINVDENPVKPQAYGVMAIPTLMLFKDGELKDKAVGVISKEKICELVTKNL